MSSLLSLSPCNSSHDNWLDDYYHPVKNDNSSSNDVVDYSHLSYVKQLGSLNCDSNDDLDYDLDLDYDIENNLPSPRPLFRMNAANEFSPPFKTQMEKLYNLKEGKTYSFLEKYPLNYSKNKKELNINNKVIGVFQEYVDKDIFRFIIDGVPYLTNRRNFEKRIRGYTVEFEEV